MFNNRLYTHRLCYMRVTKHYFGMRIYVRKSEFKKKNDKTGIFYTLHASSRARPITNIKNNYLFDTNHKIKRDKKNSRKKTLKKQFQYIRVLLVLIHFPLNIY